MRSKNWILGAAIAAMALVTGCGSDCERRIGFARVCLSADPTGPSEPVPYIDVDVTQPGPGWSGVVNFNVRRNGYEGDLR